MKRNDFRFWLYLTAACVDAVLVCAGGPGAPFFLVGVVAFALAAWTLR